VNIFKVLFDDPADRGVVCYEIGKPQTPGAPIPTNLTNNEFTFCPGFDNSLVYLLQRVDVFVIYLLSLSGHLLPWLEERQKV